jgi:rod shape-determining protein MreD
VNQILRIAVVVVAAVVVQTSVLSRFRVADVEIELVLLLAVLVALRGGAEVGAIVGFSGGLLYDTMLETPLGLAALSWALTAYAVGSLRDTFGEGDTRLLIIVGATGTATGVAVFAAFGEILGQSTMSDHPAGKIALIAGLCGGALAPFVDPVARWMVEPLRLERRAVSAGGR